MAGIFCDRRANTKEDAWPKWIGRLFSDVSRAEGLTMYSQVGGIRPRQRTWPATFLKTTARVVCKPCNGGWMSRAETQVKPFLTPMILRGEVTLLDIGQQTALAQWATKMAIVFEHTNPKSLATYYDAGARRELPKGRIAYSPAETLGAPLGRYVCFLPS